MTLHEFSLWLADTPISTQIRDNAQVVPTLQFIHIVAICVAVASALMLDLRVLGVGHEAASIGLYVRRYMPWLGWSVLVLALTGTALVVGEPNRTLENWVFWVKMALVGTGVLLTAIFALPVARDALYWDSSARRKTALAFAVLSLLTWVTVVVCGRWIAYML